MAQKQKKAEKSTFTWEGKNKDGKVLKGEIHAMSQDLVKAELRKQGIVPKTVKKKSAGLFGGGKGKGIVINKEGNTETFMKMVEAQAGLGLGAKKFRQVWVFKSQKALNDFVNSGWEFGGQGTAAAKVGEGGGDLAGAISVDVDILLYQLTEEGLALELTAKGTKYYKDDKLN